MDETLIWCALIGGIAYACEKMLPSYYDMTSVRRHSLDNMRDDILFLEDKVGSINNAVDGNEQDLMGAIKKIEDMQSDIAGHLTRLDDIDGRAIVEVRAVNYANSVNTVYRHSVQVRVNGGEWADIPVETTWGTDEEAAMYIVVNKPEEKADD